MYELIRKSFWEKNLFREFFIYANLPPPPLPLPPGCYSWIAWPTSEIKYSCPFLVVTPRHGKASAFVFTVYPFVVQAEALSATACNLSEIANSKYIIYIKYTNRVSTY